MHMRGATNEIDYVPVGVILEHFKGFPKAQISHYIEG